MSGRVAYRPHYRHTRQGVSPSKNTRQSFFYTRWSYRRQSLSYEKRPLGYSLSLIPYGYYAVRKLIANGTGL
jgi:hypothetical protein